MKTSTETTYYTIALGSFTARYIACETTAPAAYDGFGTISLHANIGPNEPRWVLMREEHADWQTMRYRSGMYGVVRFDHDMENDTRQWITDELYKRLIAGGGQ